MDLSADSWNLEVKTTFTPPSSTLSTKCRDEDTAAARAASSVPPSECNEGSQMSCALLPGPARKTQHGEEETSMLTVARGCASGASPGTPYDENAPPSIPSRSTKEGLSDAYVEALQEAGRYALWAPLLHQAFFLEGPSLLLGQIRFDVTAEDQRGSWLLPEELLTQKSGPSDEDGDDRQVFTNTPITEEEQQAIDEILMQFLELQKQEDAENTTRQCRDALLGVQPVWLEQLVLRYLHSCSFDRQKAFDLLQSTLAFRTQQLPVLESEVYHELRNMGACYWHGRDRRMRPLLVISLQRLQQLHREAAGEEKVTRLVIFCLEFFLRYLCVAGVVENWCILCDLNGTSVFDFPFPLLLRLMQLIQGSYRGRLYRFYILYAPRLFHFIAKPLVSSLATTTAKKLRVFSNIDDWHQERRAQFAAHQLEKKYGGTASDVTERWYPFRCPPGPFEPECGECSSGGRTTEVRWESEQALHTKVHPLVHTGVSLHTSLICKRSVEKGSPPFRYAAWLRHLPELHLDPPTVEWARDILRSRLQRHHDSLFQHLRESMSEAAEDSLNLPVGNVLAEGTPKSWLANEAKQGLVVNKEADCQHTPDPSVLPVAVGDTLEIPSTWIMQISSPRRSSMGNVSSASSLRMCLPTPLPGSPTTRCCVPSSFTEEDLVAVTTPPPLSPPAEHEGLKEINSPAELPPVCSSGACTSVELCQPPLPCTPAAEPLAPSATERPYDDWPRSVAASEKYSNTQPQSVSPSRTTTGATTSDACSTLGNDSQAQAVCFGSATRQGSRLALRTGSGEGITSKQVHGPPPTKVQPRQCISLSTSACNETQDAQASSMTWGTAVTHLHKSGKSCHGWILESDCRIASRCSAELSAEASKRNRLSLRRLERPIQQQQPRSESSLTSYFSNGSAFLSAAGTGEAMGIRRCSTLGGRLTDSAEANVCGALLSSQSAARKAASLRAVSASGIYRTWASPSLEGKRVFKGAQRETAVPTVQPGHQFGSRRIRLREPKLKTPAPLPQPRSIGEAHTQQPKCSGFLKGWRTSVPPSCKRQNPPVSSLGHAITVHSAQPAVGKAVSLHSRHQPLPSGKANNQRSFVAPDDMDAKCCDVSKVGSQVQNLGRDERLPQFQDAALPMLNGRSTRIQMRDKGMQLEPEIVQSTGGMSWSGSGKPRRAVGGLLPLFLLAATALNLAFCSGYPVSTKNGAFEAPLPQFWGAPQATRLFRFCQGAWSGGPTESASGGSFAVCGYWGTLRSIIQRSGGQSRNAVESSASRRGLFTIGEQGLRYCWMFPKQQVAWLQPLYSCRAPQITVSSWPSRKGQPVNPFHSVANGLLSSASCSKHFTHGSHLGPSLPAVPYGLSMRRAVRVAAVKQKSRGSIDKRFKITATGKLLYKRPGLQHHAHTKSSARRTRLRRVAVLKPSQVSRLLGPLRLRR